MPTGSDGQVGNKATIAFGTTVGFTPEVITMDISPVTRDPVDDSALSNTDELSYIPAALGEPMEISGTYIFDATQAAAAPIYALAEEITIEMPLKGAQTGGATLVGSGFLSAHGGPNIANNDLMVQQFTIKFDGKTKATYTEGTGP